ncbi:MAG: hypothetical protein ABSA18_04100 [Dehalococcoidia bacterium]|jgi:hypothetical protein
MDRVKWFESNGKRILSIDYSGLKTSDELCSVLDESVKMNLNAPGKILTLINFSNTALSSEFMDKVGRAGKEVLDARAEKVAILGVTGVKSVLFQGYLRITGAKTTRLFDNEADAMKYLVS